MKSLTLASILLIVATPASSGAFNLSFVQNLLDDLGVSVDLPEVNVGLPTRAEQAVESALSRAESVLDDVFGQGGVLDDIDFQVPNVTVPQVSVPNVDQIVNDALSDVQSQVDRALDRVPNVEQIVQDALGGVQSEVDQALGQVDSILGDLDLSGVDQVVENALGQAGSAVEDALSSADAALNEAQGVLDGLDLNGVGNTVEDALNEASRVVDGVLGDGGLLDGLLSDLPVRLPSVAQRAIDSVFGGGSSGALVTAGAAAIPEPASLGLVAIGLLAAAPRRRCGG